jgi:hypothetical protein
VFILLQYTYSFIIRGKCNVNDLELALYTNYQVDALAEYSRYAYSNRSEMCRMQ